MFWMDIKEDGNPLQGFGDPQATGGQFRLCAQTIGSWVLVFQVRAGGTGR